MKKWIKRIGLSLVVVLVVMVLAFWWYVQDYYRAEDYAMQVIETSEYVTEVGKRVVFTPNKEEDLQVGFIFYPGGKVDELAYAPLLDQLAANGITCVLFEMPFNLAVLDSNAASWAIKEFPEIDRWIIGGHSLGGAMASDYVSKNEGQIDGIVFLGAYPITDIDLPMIALVGEMDEVINRDKLKGIDVIEIAGGNHAYFGYYGEQAGDGAATISPEEQQSITVKEILSFLEVLD